MSELSWGATVEPSPVRVTICTVCGKLWGDHQNLASVNWWKEQGNGYFTEEEEPPLEELPITLEYCVALLVKANQGPQGPQGPMGPKGDKGEPSVVEEPESPPSIQEFSTEDRSEDRSKWGRGW